MFLPEHDLSPDKLATIRQFLLKDVPYSARLSFWERNDFFQEYRFQEAEPYLLPYEFKDDIAHQILTIAPQNAVERGLFLTWLLRCNGERLAKKWDFLLLKLPIEQTGTEAILLVNDLFGERFRATPLFRAAYLAQYQHELPELLEDFARNSPELVNEQLLLGVLWMQFNVRRGQPHLHFQVEFGDNPNEGLI